MVRPFQTEYCFEYFDLNTLTGCCGRSAFFALGVAVDVAVADVVGVAVGVVGSHPEGPTQKETTTLADCILGPPFHAAFYKKLGEQVGPSGGS